MASSASQALLGRCVCPVCHGALGWSSAAIVCLDCGAGYVIDGGVPVLSAWDEPTEDRQSQHKSEQAAFFDTGSAEWEIERPCGAPGLYRRLMEDKFRRATAGIEQLLPGASALTVCGGSGMDAEFLARAGAVVIASDLSLGAAQRVRERARRHGVDITPIVGDVEALPFADSSIDIVSVHDGLHHLTDPLRGLAEMARVARRAVSVSEPARAVATAIAVRFGLALEREEAGNRVARLDPAEIATTLGAFGFRVVGSERYAMYYRHEPGRPMRLLSRREGGRAPADALSAFNRRAGRIGNKLAVRAVRADEVDPLRVGMTLLSHDPGQFTGTGTYLRGILSEFGRLGAQIDVEVLCNEHALEFLAGMGRVNVALERAHGFRVGGSRASRMAAIAGAVVRSGRLVRQFSADVQVLHYPLTIAVPRTRLPTVVTLHDVQHHEMPEYFSPLRRQWRRSFYDGGARRATMVVTDSDHARERIIGILGLAPERVVAIHLAVDHERFRPEAGPDDEQLLAPLGLPERFVLYPASLWPHKNHIVLLDALARIHDDELHLLLTGAPLGRLDEIHAEAAKRGLEGRVRHLGLVADAALPALYRAATALVFPSRYEGFGAPPLEAMASGCPVASSLAASLAEVCGDAVAELDPDDAGQMAETIERVCGDRALRERLRRSGFVQARRFSWTAAAQAHLDVYRRAVELGPRSGATVG